MAISGLVGWLNIRRVVVVVGFCDEIYDGRDTLITVRLENRKKLIPSFLLQVRMLGAAVCFPVVERSGVETESIEVVLKGRGKRTLDRVEVSSRFPINFFVRKRTIPVDAGYLVIPAPRECTVHHGDGRREFRGEGFAPRKGHGGDLMRIRDYTGSESIKLIHWKLSARHEVLKVKELTMPAETPLIIDILSLPGASLEENLSHGVYLVNKTIRSGRPVGMKLGKRVVRSDLTRSHRLRLLSELAVYGTR